MIRQRIRFNHNQKLINEKLNFLLKWDNLEWNGLLNGII